MGQKEVSEVQFRGQEQKDNGYQVQVRIQRDLEETVVNFPHFSFALATESLKKEIF